MNILERLCPRLCLLKSMHEEKASQRLSLGMSEWIDDAARLLVAMMTYYKEDTTQQTVAVTYQIMYE